MLDKAEIIVIRRLIRRLSNPTYMRRGWKLNQDHAIDRDHGRRTNGDLDPVCTWRTLTGVKLNTTETSTLGQQFFDSVTKVLSRNYTKRKVFRLYLFSEILRFIRFYARTLSKMNKFFSE